MRATPCPMPVRQSTREPAEQAEARKIVNRHEQHKGEKHQKARPVCPFLCRQSYRFPPRHLDRIKSEVAAVELSSDGRQVVLRVPAFVSNWCYSVEWNVAAADGLPVRGVLHGTMH